MNFVEYPDRDMLAIDLANHLAGELETCLFSHDHASFVVPGGTTPGPVFDALCAADLDWSRVHVMLSDERWVPETSERSNTRLIRERLLTSRAAKAKFVPFYTGADEPEAAMGDLAEAIAPELPISILLIGMGADMHTASLFPGAPELDEALRTQAPAMAIRPEGQEPRVTLTAHVLRSAITTHVLITGDDKRAALERARDLSDAAAPINTVLSDATIHWAP